MRHHYVPQFLLRPWAETTSDERVQVFRLDLGMLRSDRHATKYTGYENDLWALSVDAIAGLEKQAIETRFLRYVDNLAARVLQKLDEQGLESLTRDDRMDWVRFLMSLRLRQPNLVLQLRKESADTSGKHLLLNRNSTGLWSRRKIHQRLKNGQN
jgi:Protein of unknown function (DUF4238)